MRSTRLLGAALLTMAWLMAALHVELEGAGMLPEHAHHGHAGHGHSHSSDEQGSTGHARGFAEHESMVARGSQGFATLLSLLAQLAWLGVPLVGLASLVGRFPLPTLLGPPRALREARPWAPAASDWRFHCRCAADSLAPPALR
jgi:hypothetical protein